MGWHLKHPNTFPARYFSIIRLATNSPPLEVPFFTGSFSDCKSEAEQFRYFKWCCRQVKFPMEFIMLFEEFDIRSKIIHDEIGWTLCIYARTTKLSDFIRLNPQLAEEIIPNCQ